MEKGNTCREDNVWEEPEAEVKKVVALGLKVKNWFSYKRIENWKNLEVQRNVR
jgi:hypothetical protein